MRRTPAWLAAAALATVAATAACGDDAETSGSSDLADADLQVIARDNDFDRDRYEVQAGTVTIGYVQEGQMRHTLLIEDADGEQVGDLELEVDGSDTDVGSIDLEAGTYTLYCDVPGHREAGMEAELTVE